MLIERCEAGTCFFFFRERTRLLRIKHGSEEVENEICMYMTSQIIISLHFRIAVHTTRADEEQCFARMNEINQPSTIMQIFTVSAQRLYV